jgi:hypothetical protein
LALLIAVVLMLPVDVLFLADGEKGFQILYRFLGKIYGEHPDPNNPIIKGLKKTLRLSHLDSVKTIRETVEVHGASITVKETLETLVQLIDRVIWILRYCSVPKCRITAVSGGEDAAMEYGITCAAVYPLVAYLKNKVQVRERALKVDLRCAYGLNDSIFELDLAVRVKVFHVLRALLHIIKTNVEKEVLLAEQETGKGTK